MSITDTITNLGTAIINLVGTRLSRDADNFSDAGTSNIKSLIDGRIGAITGAPVGTVIAYMGETEPDGFLLMDGREVSRTTYADLFAVIGTSQGEGDGETTFGIADMTDGRYLMGSTVAGNSVAQELPTCTGKVTTGPDTTRAQGKSEFVVTGAFAPADYSTDNYPLGTGSTVGTARAFTLDLSTSNDIYGGTTVKPLSSSCLFFIKY